MAEHFRKGERYPWSEVSKLHRARHGIYQKSGRLVSLLTDFGKLSKCYPDIESDDKSVILYTGSGRRGDQQLDVRNKALKDAIISGNPVPLFCKHGVNDWEFLGKWIVVDSDYVFEESNERMIWRFTLKTVGS